LADAVGAMEGFLAAQESGFGWNWWYTGAFSTITAAVASEQASYGKRTLPSHPDLPSDYLIGSNEFECLGKTHNTTLLSIQNDTSEVQKLVDLDSVSIMGVINSYDLCTPELNKQSLYDDLTSSNSKTLVSSIDVSDYAWKDAKTILNEKIANDAPAIYTYMLGFILDFENALTGTMHAELNFINTEIGVVQSSSDSQTIKNQKLVFLSVFKHSYYYWMDTSSN
jgi:hypothetical protein